MHYSRDVANGFLLSLCMLTVNSVGAHDYPTSGVFEVKPRQCLGFKFKKSIFMGKTCLDPVQLREFIESQSVNYNGDTYHLIFKNCNHFCEDVCSLCNCVLPEALKASSMHHDPNFQADSEKKRLRRASSCLSSISMPQREVSMSSHFSHSHYKGSLPP
ncbi:hypothetical protein PTKIN_Ptkin02bG0162500 [Pterospermum kingtungense]